MEFSAEELRAWIERYGMPQALYTDWKNVYVRPPNQAERITGAEPLTQFGRMCATLGIQIIPASSPQASAADGSGTAGSPGVARLAPRVGGHDREHHV